MVYSMAGRGSIEIIQNNSGDNSEVTEEDKSGCEREDIVQVHFV